MMLLRSLFRFVLRYRLLHAFFWTWQLFSMAHVVGEKHGGRLLVNLAHAASLVLFEMVAVYTTIYLLLPRYFNRGRYLQFGMATIGIIIAFAFLSTVADDLFVYLTLHKRIISYFIKMASSVIDMTMFVGIFIAIVIVQTS